MTLGFEGVGRKHKEMYAHIHHLCEEIKCQQSAALSLLDTFSLDDIPNWAPEDEMFESKRFEHQRFRWRHTDAAALDLPAKGKIVAS